MLEDLGQSVWIDYIRRDLIAGGELARMIAEDGLLGMTSNPAIFQKAILDGDVYDGVIKSLAAEGKDANAIYEAISLGDVRDAADVFRPVYDRTGGKDGYVSLEVDPHLAHDTEGTVAEARRLWAALGRRNVMIKVPATAEGLPAIRRLISEGISVNVTLIFGADRYLQAADAYIQGIRDRVARDLPVRGVASVASFFLSRIDTMVDPMLEAQMAGGQSALAEKAYGQVAVASAKTAYRQYGELFGRGPFLELKARGASVQRLLWASTGTKNPRFGELKYVEPLIGRDTVSTLPVKTYDAYLRTGSPTRSIENGLAEAEDVLRSLPSLGIDLAEIVSRLEFEGIGKFTDPFDKLMATLETFRKNQAGRS
jgi:transaldolase